MRWEYVGATLIFAVIGYLIGSISNAILVSKIVKKEDVRSKGSGNAGATNTLRNYGFKLGLVVFILDIVKTIIPVAIAWTFKEHSGIEWMSGTLVQAAGLAAIVGHIWPIYFKFKGGKGAASTVGFIISMQWPLFFIGFASFIIIVALTKKVSLGSMLGILIVILFQIGFAFTPHMTDKWAMPFMYESKWWVNTIFLLIIWSLVVIKHIPNIKRLIKGEESTLKL